MAAHESSGVSVPNCVFNYETEVWEPRSYMLPWFNGDYVMGQAGNLADAA